MKKEIASQSLLNHSSALRPLSSASLTTWSSPHFFPDCHGNKFSNVLSRPPQSATDPHLAARPRPDHVAATHVPVPPEIKQECLTTKINDFWVIFAGAS